MFEYSVSLSYLPAGVSVDELDDITDELCWHEVDYGVPQKHMPGVMRHVCHLLERAKGRVNLHDLYLTAGAEGEAPTHDRRDVLLPHQLLTLLAACKMQFSYGVFCSFFKNSRYKTDRFNVLTTSTPELWASILATRNEKMDEWNTLVGEYQGRPYMVLDARENGATSLLYFLAERADAPLSGTVRLDYFTNNSWCFWDLDDEDFANLSKLGIDLELSLHPAMKTAPDEGSVDPALLRHALRTARRLRD